MTQASSRILLVDSSVPRAQEVGGALAKAGWEIWPGRNVRDALVLAAGLEFQVVLAHETSMQQHPELWNQLAESIPAACWLVHGEKPQQYTSAASGCGVLGSEPVLILAVIMLLLEARPAYRAQAA